MPGKNDDDQRDDQNLEGDEPDEADEQDDTAADDADGDSDADAGGEAPDAKKKLTGDAKRIADLTSARDREAARANKAEQALKAAKQGGGGSQSDPATQALMTELREASLDAVFAEFPQLRDYGIDRSLIEGSTRAELRENATSLVGLIKNVETKVRNKVLADNGITAPASGDRVRKPVDYKTMSDEDFEKVLNGIS